MGRAVFGLFLSALLFAFLFGCAGNGNPAVPQAKNQPANSGAQLPPANAQTQNESGSVGTTKNTITSEPAKKESASDQLSKFISSKFTSKWKANYKITNKASDGTSVENEMGMFILDEKNLRTDFDYSGMKMRVYLKGGETFTCNYFGIKWDCYSMPYTNNDTAASVESGFESNPVDYSVEPAAPKLVAGTLAECFKVTNLPLTATSTIVTFCYSPEGIPLYTDTIYYAEGTRGESKMEATSYSKNVLQSDFELPATPKDISSMIGGNPCDYCSYLSGSDKDSCLQSCGGN